MYDESYYPEPDEFEFPPVKQFQDWTEEDFARAVAVLDITGDLPVDLDSSDARAWSNKLLLVSCIEICGDVSLAELMFDERVIQ